MQTYKVSFSTMDAIYVEATTFKIESDSYIFYKDASCAVASFKRSTVVSVTAQDKSNTDGTDEINTPYETIKFASTLKGQTLRSTMIGMLKELNGSNGIRIYPDLTRDWNTQGYRFILDGVAHDAQMRMPSYDTIEYSFKDMNTLKSKEFNFTLTVKQIKATDILNLVSKLVYLNNLHGNNLILYIQDLDFRFVDGIECYVLDYFLGYVDVNTSVNTTCESHYSISNGIAQDSDSPIYYWTLHKDGPVVQIML